MRTLRTLVGPAHILVAALKTGRFKSTGILGIKYSEVIDGNFELTTIDGEMPLKDKLELTIDGAANGPNHVIALRDTNGTVVGHLLIEDAKLDAQNANPLAEILIAGAYDETTGNVRDAKDGTVLMPANVTSDRARIRLLDGTYVEINLANQLGSGDMKLTASLIPAIDDKPAVLVIGAEGQQEVYAKPVDQLILEARDGKVDNIGEQISLDSPLKRITRAKDEEVTIQTEGGNYKAKLDADGQVEINKIETKQKMDANDDTLGSWDSIGETSAVLDADGNSVQAWAKAGDKGALKLAFVPNSATKAPEVQA